MFDEYAHLVSNNFEDGNVNIAELHTIILESMVVRTASYIVDTYDNFLSNVKYNQKRISNLELILQYLSQKVMEMKAIMKEKSV